MKKKIFISTVLVLMFMVFIYMGITIKYINNTEQKSKNNNSEVQEKTYATYTYITEDMKKNVKDKGIMASYLNEYTPDYMLEQSDAVALVTIVSIDYASVEESILGMTYGKMVINNVIVGNLDKGSLVDYAKSGGIVSVAEYDKYDIPESVAKRDYLYEQAGIKIDKEDTYLKLKMSGDIEIEAGKTYLAYLNYIEEYNNYEIIGLGYGLREVNIDQVSKVSTQSYNMNNLKIKNNETGEWESLNEYVRENLEKK